jgi:hypothetical protein
MVLLIAVAAAPAAALTQPGHQTSAVPALPGAPASAHPGGGGRAALERFVGRAGRAAGGHAGSVVLDGSPGNPVANPQTATLYVPVQCRNPSTGATCAATASHVVDVVGTARCNAKVGSGCRVIARMKAGKSPLVAVIDPRTDTVYVANQFDDTVSVVNGARCNARVTSGCGRIAATIKVGKDPNAAVINPVTRTLYVANLTGGSISVISTATCNATTTRGCGRPPRTVQDKLGAQWLDVNTVTDTIYAANPGPHGNGDTVSVIDGAT